MKETLAFNGLMGKWLAFFYLFIFLFIYWDLCKAILKTDVPQKNKLDILFAIATSYMSCHEISFLSICIP